ncbi:MULTISPECIES: ANTAR domain-containing response regulator [unclassified Geodermatophilus]
MQRMLDEVRREVTRLLEQEADAARDEEVAALRREVAQLREALASRAVIERAKGFLMHERGIDEGQAYDRLNDLAQRHRRKVRDVAAEITAQPVGQQVASAAARTNGVVVTPS